jgi:hypothetical protein
MSIWLNFGGPWNGKCWYILWSLGIFYGKLVSFKTIWYILSLFGIYFSRFGMCQVSTKNAQYLTIPFHRQQLWILARIIIFVRLGRTSLQKKIIGRFSWKPILIIYVPTWVLWLLFFGFAIVKNDTFLKKTNVMITFPAKSAGHIF